MQDRKAPIRKASIKETGEELPSAEWERFDAAVADLKAERREEQAKGDESQPPASTTSPAVV